MISTSDFAKGLWIELDGDPWQILDVTRQAPTARGASLIVKVKIRNAKTGSVQDKSFRGGDKVGVPNVEERGVQYLYSDSDGYHFMDQESYEQFFLSADELEGAKDYLIENLEVGALMLDGRPIGIQLPSHVDLVVTECPPPIKGTGSGQTKTAKLETGAEIQVPPYLEQGEKVRVDTRDGRFIQRVKE